MRSAKLKPDTSGLPTVRSAIPRITEREMGLPFIRNCNAYNTMSRDIPISGSKPRKSVKVLQRRRVPFEFVSSYM